VAEVTSRLLCALAGLALAGAAPAQAQEITGAPMARDLDSRAFTWWARPMSCHPAAMRTFVADFGGTGLDYTPPGCVSYVDRQLWNAAQGWPLTVLLEARRERLCRVWFHKWGHTAWLGHAPGWVMSGDGLDAIPAIGQCNLFARSQG
jgi:hypothetical protein